MQQQKRENTKNPSIFYCVARKGKTQSRARIFMKEAAEKVQKMKNKIVRYGEKKGRKNWRMLLKGRTHFFISASRLFVLGRGKGSWT